MKYACTYCGDFAQMELYNEIIVKLTPDYSIANIKEFFEIPLDVIINHY